MHDGPAPGAWFLLRYTEYAALARRPLPPAARDAALRRAALHFIAAHPTYPIVLAGENLRRWLGLAGPRRARTEAATIDVSGGWADAALPFAWVVAGLALAGLGAVRRQPALWLGPGALLAVTLLVNAETPRFRAPLDPFLILLAAAFIAGRRRMGIVHPHGSSADPLRRHRRRARPSG
jgi:hypothetical protein